MTKKDRLFNKYFILLLIASACINLGHNTLNLAIPVYCDGLFSSSFFAGIITWAFGIMAVAGRFVAGRLADSWSRRWIMTLGCVIFALAVLALSLTKSMPVIAIARAMQGLGYSMLNTAAAAAVLDVVSKENAEKAIGWFWLSNSIAFGLSGYITAAFEGDGFSVLFFIITGLFIIAALATFLCTYSSHIGKDNSGDDNMIDLSELSFAERFIDKSSLPLSACLMAAAFAASLTTVFGLLLGNSRGFLHTELFTIIAAVMLITCNKLYDIMCAKFSSQKVICFGLALHVVGLSCLALFPSNATYFLCAITMGALLGICLPGMTALATVGVPENRRGIASATIFIAIDVGTGVGAAVWGLMIDEIEFRLIFGIAAAILLVTLIPSYMVIGKKQSKQ